METKQLKLDLRELTKNLVLERISIMAPYYAKKVRVSGVVGWIGGKKAVADKIVNLLPPHKVYVEAFAGGAAVFFKKKKAEVNVINDINNNLVNLYRVVGGSAEEFNEFIYLLWSFVNSNVLFDELLFRYESTEWNKLKNVERAAIYYYLIDSAFNNDMESSVFANNFKDFTYSVAMKLISAREQLMSTLILNKDFRKVVDMFNKKDGNVLFFFDPPYVVADEGKYYENIFNKLDHRNLKEKCDEIDKNGNMFFVTYDDVPFIRNLYKNYLTKEIEMTYTATFKNNKKKTELIITNFKPKEQLTLF